MNDQPSTTPENQTPDLDDVPTIPLPPADNSPVENVTPVEAAPAIDMDAENLRILNDSEPDTMPVGGNAPAGQPTAATSSVIAPQPTVHGGRKVLVLTLVIFGVLIVFAVGIYVALNFG